jgi:hypothetical protein
MKPHPVTPDMAIKAATVESFMILILWTDPFQPKSDWWTTVSDGISG